MASNLLTAIQVQKAKAAEKAYKLSDGGGMYLLVDPLGRKYWRLDYRFAGKRKTLALGVFPEVTLEAARKRRREAKDAIESGGDPCEQRKVDKLTLTHREANTFEAVAREWHKEFKPTWTEHTANKNLRILEVNAFPWIGARVLEDVTAPELLDVIRRVKERGLLDTAHRLRMTCGQVFRYGIQTGRCVRDISSDLRGAIPPNQKEHFAAITEEKEFGALLRDLWAYQGHFATCCALKLSVLCGLRPGEVRQLEWSEVMTDDGLIRIPLEKMKKRRLHVVPLTAATAAILEELRPLTGAGRYCFPGMQSKDRPMSENTINAALRRMGYDTQAKHCAHGFRSSFSTMAHGSNLFRAEVVEVQLSHKHGDAVRLAYDRGDFLEERRKLMAWWSSECERMRKGAEVIELHHVA
jgi:integrase